MSEADGLGAPLGGGKQLTWTMRWMLLMIMAVSIVTEERPGSRGCPERCFSSSSTCRAVATVKSAILAWSWAGSSDMQSSLGPPSESERQRTDTPSALTPRGVQRHSTVSLQPANPGRPNSR